jgi:hypothetical protein
MSRYARVENRTWADEKFRALSRPQPNAQSLFLYLLTGPHAEGPGCFEAGEYGLAEKLRWPIEGFRAAMQELLDAQMVRVDWDAQVVWVVNMVNHDPPANGNVLKHWLDLLETVPECALKARYMETLEPYAERFGISFSATVARTVPETVGQTLNLNQNQLPEPETTTARARASSPRGTDFLVFTAVLAESGTPEAKLTPATKNRPLRLARDLLADGYPLPKILACFRYLRSQHWRTKPVTLATVRGEIGDWEAAGCPERERTRAGPNGALTDGSGGQETNGHGRFAAFVSHGGAEGEGGPEDGGVGGGAGSQAAGPPGGVRR